MSDKYFIRSTIPIVTTAFLAQVLNTHTNVLGNLAKDNVHFEIYKSAVSRPIGLFELAFDNVNTASVNGTCSNTFICTFFT